MVVTSYTLNTIIQQKRDFLISVGAYSRITMPVNIYRSLDSDGENEPVDYLCKDDWELPTQVDALERWLSSSRANLSLGSYVADIGFSVREEATGGGGVFTIAMLTKLLEIGMEIYLSEYHFAETNDPAQDVPE